MHALNIDIICANSSPAKGRVERANKTLQDRLVKELRLAGAATLAEGNALLPAFIADYNARFAKAPANSKDLHRPLAPGDDLDDAFAWKEERTLSRALTLQYDKVAFHPGAERASQSGDRQAGHRRRLPRRPAGDPLPRASNWPIAPSTRSDRSTRQRLSRTSGLAPRSRLHPRAADRTRRGSAVGPPRATREQIGHMFKVG